MGTRGPLAIKFKNETLNPTNCSTSQMGAIVFACVCFGLTMVIQYPEVPSCIDIHDERRKLGGSGNSGIDTGCQVP